MELLVQRRPDDGKSVQGSLSVDGTFECCTLEPSATAAYPTIPAGRYRVLLMPSERFQQLTPHIEAVPGRSYIEIHPGNFPKDTQGCTLVGWKQITDFVGSSRAAFQSLMTLLKTEPDNLWITYEDAIPFVPSDDSGAGGNSSA